MQRAPAFCGDSLWQVAAAAGDGRPDGRAKERRKKARGRARERPAAACPQRLRAGGRGGRCLELSPGRRRRGLGAKLWLLLRPVAA